LEKPVTFLCDNNILCGILHEPDNNPPITIVAMVVGGYQTRYGSHRLYVQLARYLARHGHSVLRFDYEGMGDSQGNFVGFRNAGPSINAAVDFLSKLFHNKKIIIWSLCDGSSASAIYAYENPEKISGLILSNTYISTEKSFAMANLKYYYTSRLKEINFWKKFLSFQINYQKSLQEITNSLKKIAFARSPFLNFDHDENRASLPKLVLLGLNQLGKPITCIIANEDILAKEFYSALRKDKKSKKLLSQKKIVCHIIKGARHTFDQPEAKKKLFDITLKALDNYL